MSPSQWVIIILIVIVSHAVYWKVVHTRLRGVEGRGYTIPRSTYCHFALGGHLRGPHSRLSGWVHVVMCVRWHSAVPSLPFTYASRTWKWSRCLQGGPGFKGCVSRRAFQGIPVHDSQSLTVELQHLLHECQPPALCTSLLCLQKPLLSSPNQPRFGLSSADLRQPVTFQCPPVDHYGDRFPWCRWVAPGVQPHVMIELVYITS